MKETMGLRRRRQWERKVKKIERRVRALIHTPFVPFFFCNRFDLISPSPEDRQVMTEGFYLICEYMTENKKAKA